MSFRAGPLLPITSVRIREDTAPNLTSAIPRVVSDSPKENLTSSFLFSGHFPVSWLSIRGPSHFRPSSSFIGGRLTAPGNWIVQDPQLGSARFHTLVSLFSTACLEIKQTLQLDDIGGLGFGRLSFSNCPWARSTSPYLGNAKTPKRS